jgi:hypothetical protein
MVINAIEGGQFTVTHAGAPGKSKVGLIAQVHSLVIPGSQVWMGVTF